MFFKAPHLFLLLLLYLLIKVTSSDNSSDGFTYNGNLELGGFAEVTPYGLFKLGQAFYRLPYSFKNSSNGNASSFSTTFVFSLFKENSYGGHGMAFLIAPSTQTHGYPAQYLGLFNSTNVGNPSNHIVAIEFDTFQNEEFGDINGNHVGIDINGLESVNSTSAGYFATDKDGDVQFKNLTLASGDPIQCWVDYDGAKKQLSVTLSPLNMDRPSLPLLSLNIDISPFILEQMYVGFSSANGRLIQSSYVLGWSFRLNREAHELDLSKLPSLPHRKNSKNKVLKRVAAAIGLSAAGVVLLTVVVIFVTILVGKRKAKFGDHGVEDWEVEYGPHRFPYKELCVATKGFKVQEVLGRGGFGEVFKGVMPTSGTEVAVKRISHKSRQGMKEFVAEIATIGRLRHPNLVRLLGYCRQKGDLFLVYDLMSNASVDKFLFDDPETTLDWGARFKIIKDVASGLRYLHEEWVEVIVHRDIKASNVLLDGELNGKLGDFGLARCSDRGKDPQTTQLAGTLGYIAPELARNGKATTATDIFAFGAFCLEVGCGRRPVERRAVAEEVILVDWVLEWWKRGDVLKAADHKLRDDFKRDEMELVLKLGLLCSHPVAAIRPSMSQVLGYLSGDALLPDKLDAHWEPMEECWGSLSHSHLPLQDSRIPSLTITESFISTGR